MIFTITDLQFMCTDEVVMRYSLKFQGEFWFDTENFARVAFVC